MKILYINAFYHPYVQGGAEITLQHLVERLQTRGHETSILTTGSLESECLVEDNINGVRVLRTKLINAYWHYGKNRPPSWKRALWHVFDVYNPLMENVVYKIIRLIRPDVVSLHNLAGFSAAAWNAVRRTGTPMVQVLHDYYSLCPNSNMFRNNKICTHQCMRCRFLRFIHPKLSNSVDAVVGVSRFVIDSHLNNGLFKSAQFKQVIHNTRSLSHLPQELSVEPRVPIRLGFMGTLAPSKGIELLLEVFIKIKSKNIVLIVAGSGKLYYEKMLKERFSMPRIHFLGYVPTDRFFPDIDVLIVPSIWNDSLPGVVFESLAYGVPVIGSNRGGIPEILQHGVNGFLFDPYHPEQMESLINMVTRDRGLIESMGENCFRTVKPFLNVSNWIDKWEALYGKVMGRRKTTC